MNADAADAGPRSVLVADDDLYLSIAHDPHQVKLLDDTDSMIVPYSADAELNAAAVDTVRGVLRQNGRLIPGSILVRNPYRLDSYEVADEALSALSVAKYHAFANLSRLLGATEVRFLEAKIESETMNLQSMVAAILPVGGAEAEAAREVVKKLKDKLSGHLMFGGGEPDTQAAESYLERSGLAHDPQMRSIVEMRTGGNLLTRYEFSLSGTRESTANLTSALKIASMGPVKAADIGAKFALVTQAVSDVEIKTEIIF